MGTYDRRVIANEKTPVEAKLHEAFTDLQKSITAIDQIEFQGNLPSAIKAKLKGFVKEMEGLAERIDKVETDIHVHEVSNSKTAAIPTDVPLPRLERVVEGIGREAHQMRYSLDMYKKDPGKYQPQLENLARSAAEVRTMGGVILRALGEKDF